MAHTYTTENIIAIINITPKLANKIRTTATRVLKNKTQAGIVDQFVSVMLEKELATYLNLTPGQAAAQFANVQWSSVSFTALDNLKPGWRDIAQSFQSYNRDT